MEIQNDLLNKFKRLYNDPTYKEIASLTGIQLTRVFRLFNGFEMKLSEYLIFTSLLEDKRPKEFALEQVVSECVRRLSDESLVKIENYCKRHLELITVLKEVTKQEIA